MHFTIGQSDFLEALSAVSNIVPARTPLPIIGNVLIAAGNSGDRSLLPLVLPLLADGSALVRAMAVWALGQLGGVEEVAKARAVHLPRETDDAVRCEWVGEQTA